MQPARADAASAPLDFEDRAEFNATKALHPILRPAAAMDQHRKE
jgi:hypothetical protein